MPSCWGSTSYITISSTTDNSTAGTTYYDDTSTASCTWVSAPTWTYYPGQSQPRKETGAEKRTRLEQERIKELEQEALRKEQEAAVKAAEELLKEHIGLKAFGELYKVGYIELNSHKHKGRKYRIPANHMAYIEILDEKGNVIDTLCTHPAIECPAADHILARLIYLEMDEEALLVAANHWGKREHSYYEGGDAV